MRPTTPTPPGCSPSTACGSGLEPDTRVISDATRFQLARSRRPALRGCVTSPTAPHRPPDCSPSTGSCPSTSSSLPRWSRSLGPKRGLVGPTARQTATAKERRSAFDKRASCSTSWSCTAALKAERGVMDFSDQIALAARLARRVPRWAPSSASDSRSSCSTSTRTPRWPRLGCCAAVLRPRRRERPRAPGHGRRRPLSGDLRLARGVGLQHPAVSRGLPARQREPRRALSAQRQPALRPTDPRDGQRARRPLVRRCGRSSPLEAAGRRAGRGVRLAVHETYEDELGPGRRRGAGRARDRRPWSEIAVLTRDNEHGRHPRRAHQRRRARRDRRALGPAPAARSRRGRRAR